eukprot:1476285-Pyramimonas_sp.AAC.1
MPARIVAYSICGCMPLCPNSLCSEATRLLATANGDDEKDAEAQCREKKKGENQQHCGELFKASMTVLVLTTNRLEAVLAVAGESGAHL